MRTPWLFGTCPSIALWSASCDTGATSGPLHPSLRIDLGGVRATSCEWRFLFIPPSCLAGAAVSSVLVLTRDLAGMSHTCGVKVIFSYYGKMSIIINGGRHP